MIRDFKNPHKISAHSENKQERFSPKNIKELNWKITTVLLLTVWKISSIHTPTACLLKKLIFWSICIHYHQSDSALYVEKAVKAITDMKKSAKATADVKPLKVKKRPNQTENFAIF